MQLQQHLPFTVLKLTSGNHSEDVAKVATASTVYGIETILLPLHSLRPTLSVATASTVYGIETTKQLECCLAFLKLQQHLPFTVLKPLQC